MLTTVGYQLGPHAPVVYALEVHSLRGGGVVALVTTISFQGSVAIGGQSVKWLRDNLELFKEARDIGLPI